MRKVRMEIELEYDDEIMHGAEPDSEKWFFNDILGGKGDLLLHSNEVGDTLGPVTLVRRIDIDY